MHQKNNPNEVKNWTPAEISYLKRAVKKEEPVSIVSAYLDRSPGSIYKKCWRLGFGSQMKNEVWHLSPAKISYRTSNKNSEKTKREEIRQRKLKQEKMKKVKKYAINSLTLPECRRILQVLLGNHISKQDLQQMIALYHLGRAG